MYSTMASQSSPLFHFKLFRFLHHFIWVNFPGRLEAVEDLVPQPLDASHPEAVRVVPEG